MEKVTQETIAEQLHLSRNTVSKVFNGIPGVKAKTRERILEQARLLGYTHPLLGNAGGPPDENTPVSKSTESRPTAELRYDIAFVCYQKSISDFFWMPIILNLERTLSQHGCTMRFVVIGLEHEQTMSPPGALLNNPPDGIVMAGLFQSEYYKSISSLGIPLVTFDISSDLFHCNRMCDVIMVENLGASYIPASLLPATRIRVRAFLNAGRVITWPCRNLLSPVRGKSPCTSISRARIFGARNTIRRTSSTSSSRACPSCRPPLSVETTISPAMSSS